MVSNLNSEKMLGEPCWPQLWWAETPVYHSESYMVLLMLRVLSCELAGFTAQANDRAGQPILLKGSSIIRGGGWARSHCGTEMLSQDS